MNHSNTSVLESNSTYVVGKRGRVKACILSAIFIVVVMVAIAQSNKTRLDISNGWKFAAGDNRNSIQPGFDDNNWKLIRTGLALESQGYTDFNGVGFYRVKVVTYCSSCNI